MPKGAYFSSATCNGQTVKLFMQANIADSRHQGDGEYEDIQKDRSWYHLQLFWCPLGLGMCAVACAVSSSRSCRASGMFHSA